MKTTALSLITAAALALGNVALAAGAKDYQVTGPVLEVTDAMIAVKKGNDRWEIAKDSSTKGAGDLKVGDKVTVHYTMTATEVEAKAAAKSGDKAAKSGASPAKKK
ncbi:MAG: hypothetical protein M3128_09405 [Verrucomicrobiota bacterium]|nr:hypothetical protein [Verrucomicrobiota bacterium]